MATESKIFKFKIFNTENKYIAAVKHGEDAACLIALNGDGSTVRYAHGKNSILYTQGKDGDASESYDAVATILEDRYHRAFKAN